jgi:hypothetical protein
MIESRQEIRRAVVLHVHPVDLLLAVSPLRVPQLAQTKIVAAKIYQLVADRATVAAPPEMLVRGAKSLIHAGFVQRHKIAINRESVRASSSQIFRMK